MKKKLPKFKFSKNNHISKRAKELFFKESSWSEEYPVEFCTGKYEILKEIGVPNSERGYVESNISQSVCLECKHCNTLNAPFLFCLLQLDEITKGYKTCKGYRFEAYNIIGANYKPHEDCPQYFEWLIAQETTQDT